VCLSAALSAASVAGQPETKTVVVGPQYSDSWLHRVFFGSDYRELWTTPVSVEVLDLETEAGGLSPVRRVGGQQTKGLALKGRDGKNYTFRGLEKDASELVEAELRGTVVESVLQDQMAAQHPASELIARVILDAAGIPCPPWRLVVLPDDPVLAAFRKDFAGAVGVFAEYPSAVSDTNPGFRGATEIVDHATLYKKLEAGEGDAIDARALLEARLVDILMGDWDRHRKQWRWARFPGSPLWTAIPEDRDQAFSRYEGYVLDRARARDGRLQKFGPRYPNIGGLTYNGWEQDRRLLVGLTRDDFQAAARELRERISDAVIERAAAAMPAEWARIDGPRLIADLKARRDALPAVAETYYRHLADRVDVYMTDRSEHVEARRSRNGDLSVSIAILDADGRPGPPYFERVFHADQTEEVRLHALSGNDTVVVTGRGHRPRLRVIGGPGDDRLDAREGDAARLSDSSGHNQALGAELDAREYVPPPPPKNAPWIPPRDWGSETWTMPWVSYNGDIGVFVGAGLEHRNFAFRKDPYSARQVLRAGYGFGAQRGRVDYAGEFHRENRSSVWGLRSFASGLEVLRFYGFGNETTNPGNKDFFRAEATQFLVYPSISLRFGETTSLTLGPALKYTRTRSEETLVNQLEPYGVGSFGALAVHAVLAHDGRDDVQYTRRGVFLAARGTLFPEAWDVARTFGEVNGNANGYLSLRGLTLAARVGGKKVFGEYPYMEAAAIGGGGLGAGALAEPDYTLRGYRTRRFQGDAAAYANADLRLHVSRINLVLPGDWGLLGFFDVGRVWLAGERSDTWHTGAGGGIWISLMSYRATFSAGLAHSSEDDILYFKGGFTF